MPRLRWLVLGAVAVHIVTISLGAGFVFLVSSDVYTVETSSMEPTIHCSRAFGLDDGCRGDFPDDVVVSPIPYLLHEPRRGDIVVFSPPVAALRSCEDTRREDMYVKRVVGLPGERIEERRGVIYVDGARIPEPYLHGVRDISSSTGVRVVPDGHLFVLGDERFASCDSRHFGFVARHGVRGKVVAVW
jgi:signal peptidase I